MHDIHENIEEYNPYKENKTLIEFDITVDMTST